MANDATHVVTQIQWGSTFNALFTYENDELDYDHVAELTGRLLASLQTAIRNRSDSNKERDSTLESEDFLKDRLLSVKVYRDYEAGNGSLNNVEAVLRCVREARVSGRLEKENGNGYGCPMMYFLFPLDLLRNHFDIKGSPVEPIIKIPDDNVLRLVEVFDDVLAVRQSLHDLWTDLQNFEQYLPGALSYTNEVKVLRWELEKAEDEFCRALAIEVPRIRLGRSDPTTLDNLIREYKAHPFSAPRVRTCLQNTFHDAIDDILLIRDAQRKGVQICGKSQSLESFIQQPGATWFVLFYKRSNSEEEKEHHVNNQMLLTHLQDQLVPKLVTENKQSVTLLCKRNTVLLLILRCFP